MMVYFKHSMENFKTSYDIEYEIPLFNGIEEELEVEASIDNKNVECDAKMSLNTTMEVSLGRVTQLTTPNSTPSMTTIQSMASSSKLVMANTTR
jgi:hypothetical protein